MCDSVYLNACVCVDMYVYVYIYMYIFIYAFIFNTQKVLYTKVLKILVDK